MAINVGALLFLVPIWFFAFWPTVSPVQASTMNWAPVMYVGIIGISMCYYFFKGRYLYDGPIGLIRMDVHNS